MNIARCPDLRILTLGILACLAASAPPAHAAGAAAGQASRFGLAEDPQQPVITYTEVIPLIRDRDPIPLLRVYADGRVLVHYPAGFTRAGDYRVQLGRAGLESLLAELEAAGVLAFDPRQAELERQQAAAQKAAAQQTGQFRTATIRMDASTSVLALSLDRYEPPGSAGAAAPLRKTVLWKDLQFDAGQHPSAAALQGLAAAERRLRSLAEHPDLERMD